MAKIPYETAEAFLQHKYSRNGAFVSTGDSLHSYNQRLAHWDGDHIVIDCLDKPSATTARHVAAFSRTLDITCETYVEGDKLIAKVQS